MYIDAHCHLDVARFDADRAAVMACAAAQGITGYLVAGVDPEGWLRQRRLAAAHRSVAWTAGLHPVSVAQMDAEDRERALAALPQCFTGDTPAIGVGETGLDRRFADPETVPIQVEVLRAHLALARDADLPVVLHVVSAHGQTLDVLRRDGLPAAGGMVHSYSGSADLVAEYVALGLSISFSGNVVRPTAKKVRKAVSAVPRDRLLVETDAPDQSPVGRGVRNEPTTLLEVACCVAALRGGAADEILTLSRRNLERIFGPQWPLEG
jgi:TatD DNase family protein